MKQLRSLPLGMRPSPLAMSALDAVRSNSILIDTKSKPSALWSGALPCPYIFEIIPVIWPRDSTPNPARDTSLDPYAGAARTRPRRRAGKAGASFPSPRGCPVSLLQTGFRGISSPRLRYSTLPLTTAPRLLSTSQITRVFKDAMY